VAESRQGEHREVVVVLEVVVCWMMTVMRRKRWKTSRTRARLCERRLGRRRVWRCVAIERIGRQQYGVQQYRRHNEKKTIKRKKTNKRKERERSREKEKCRDENMVERQTNVAMVVVTGTETESNESNRLGNRFKVKSRVNRQSNTRKVWAEVRNEHESRVM
jgi:hypothetical protein